MADTVGGMCAGLAALPGWVVSTNLMLRTVPGAHVGPLALDATVLRAGRKAVVAQVEIRDAGDGGALIADGVLTSAVLEPEGGPPDFPRPMQLVPPDERRADPPAARVLRDRRPSPTASRSPITDRVRNPWGILHGGATAVLVDAAGTHADRRGRGDRGRRPALPAPRSHRPGGRARRPWSASAPTVTSCGSRWWTRARTTA